MFSTYIFQIVTNKVPDMIKNKGDGTKMHHNQYKYIPCNAQMFSWVKGQQYAVS